MIPINLIPPLGLDIVELVIRTEEVFNIIIDNYDGRVAHTSTQFDTSGGRVPTSDRTRHHMGAPYLAKPDVGIRAKLEPNS